MSAFKWRNLRQVALDLLRPPSSEARRRSAINRSYYAAFGEARHFAQRHGYVANMKSGSSHLQVWLFIRNGKGLKSKWELPAWRAIGDAGLALKAQRKWADYEDSPPPTEDDARQAVAQAHNIIKRLAGLS